MLSGDSELLARDRVRTLNRTFSRGEERRGAEGRQTGRQGERL